MAGFPDREHVRWFGGLVGREGLEAFLQLGQLRALLALDAAVETVPLVDHLTLDQTDELLLQGGALRGRLMVHRLQLVLEAFHGFLLGGLAMRGLERGDGRADLGGHLRGRTLAEDDGLDATVEHIDHDEVLIERPRRRMGRMLERGGERR